MQDSPNQEEQNAQEFKTQFNIFRNNNTNQESIHIMNMNLLLKILSKTRRVFVHNIIISKKR